MVLCIKTFLSFLLTDLCSALPAFFRFFARREEANLAISIIQVVVVCFGQAGLVLLAWKLLKQFGFR